MKYFIESSATNSFFCAIKSVSLAERKQCENEILGCITVCPLDDVFFLTATWESHGQLWAILERTTSLTQC